MGNFLVAESEVIAQRVFDIVLPVKLVNGTAKHFYILGPFIGVAAPTLPIPLNFGCEKLFVMVNALLNPLFAELSVINFCVASQETVFELVIIQKTGKQNGQTGVAERGITH